MNIKNTASPILANSNFKPTPFYQNFDDFPQKTNKTIEIVVVPKIPSTNNRQENIGITIDENIILGILSKHYLNVVITEINTQDDLNNLILRKPDLVFSGVKYFHFNGKNIWLSDYLQSHGVGCIASNKKALNNEYDKALAKDIMKKENIATADYFVTKPGEYLTKESIPIKFPLFIKPLSSGDSIGIDANSVVYDFKNFEAKVLDIYHNKKYHSLVEQYLSGKEYSVGILVDKSNDSIQAMPIEIIVKPNKNGHCILDFDIKTNDYEKVVAVTDLKIHRQLSDLAKNAFKALGGELLGRIDIRMDSNKTPYFIEANLMPGLRKGYFYRACLLNLDMSYEKMILTIAANGLSA